VKGRLKYIIILVAILAVALHWDSVRFAQTEDRKPLSEMIVATYDVDKLLIGDRVDTLVVVQANTEEANTTGILFAYTRTRGEDGKLSAWRDEIIGIPVTLGRRGVGRSEAWDKKTPIGIYSLHTPSGNGAFQEGFPQNYVQIPGDSPENKYTLVIGYETGTGEPAVLLKCFDKDAGSTDGSVATDEETMKQILCLYKEGSTGILIEEKGRFSQYY